VFFRYTPHNPIYNECLCSVAEFAISMVLLTWDLWTGGTVLYSALWCYCGIQNLHHTLAARGGVQEIQTSASSFMQGEIILLQYRHLAPSPYNWCSPSTAWQSYIYTVFLVLYDNVQRESPKPYGPPTSAT
jgi:hypothetical protein